MEKRKKPKFLRSESHKKIRLGRTVKKKRKWKAAKGRQNKIRLQRKGRARKPKIGWGAPKEIKNKINGKETILVSTPKQLEKIDNTKAIIISGKTGNKKKQEIIKLAKEKKIEIINPPKIKKKEENESR